MNALQRKTIHDVLVALSDGDRSAFPILLAELWPVILAYAKRAIGHAQDAEDVAQETFLRICARISEFDRKRDGVSWAFAIASFEILTHRRRQQRRREAPLVSQLERHTDPRPSHEELLIREELLAALAEVLGTLSDADRSLLEEAPRSMPIDLPGATLRKRRQRAVGRVRTIWRRLHGEP